MNDNSPETVPIPPAIIRSSFWAASRRRRRPAILIALLVGLVLFILWMPSGTRASLWADLMDQRELVILLFVFALLTLSLIWSAGQRIDTWVFTLFNMRGYPQWLDRFMWLVTQLGSMLAAFIVALVFFVFDYRDLAVEIILGTLTLWLLVETIKALADRQRPFHTLGKTRVIGWQEKGDSFPSGHTTQIFFMATFFIHHFTPGMTEVIALYAVAALVGFTRIYVGAHYPRDVIAGLVLGSVWGILAALMTPYWLVLRF